MVVIGELKLSFSLDLVLQAVDRTAACDEVWLAVGAAGSNCKPQSIRLQADRSRWVSEELLLPTMSQEALWATDVHPALSRATLQSQRAVQPRTGQVLRHTLQLIALRDVQDWIGSDQPRPGIETSFPRDRG
jgi:hypothetical protein